MIGSCKRQVWPSHVAAMGAQSREGLLQLAREPVSCESRGSRGLIRTGDVHS